MTGYRALIDDNDEPTTSHVARRVSACCSPVRGVSLRARGGLGEVVVEGRRAEQVKDGLGDVRNSWTRARR